VSERDELLAIARQAKEHVAWLERGGVIGMPRGEVPPPRPVVAKPAVAAPAVAKPAAPVAAPIVAPASTGGGAAKLAAIREELGDCTRCKLAGKRTNIVYGVGNPDAPLVFVGEAPGADEDRTGEPFVGAAGQLLTKMIEAMGYARSDVYICNVLKCRPPANRNPEPDEVASCEPFLKKQLGAIRPRIIVALGKFAVQCLLRDDSPIGRLRGNLRTYEGIPLMPTFHPAYLLRDPSKKKLAWDDLKAVNAALANVGISPPRPPAA
jgi:uracil-DNA glycosylase